MKISRTLYRRAKGSFYIRRTIQGRRRVITLHGIATEEGAKHCALLCDMAIAEGRIEEFVSRFERKKRISLNNAIDEWLQYSIKIKKNNPKVITAKKRSISSLIPFISNTLNSISLNQLETWVSHRNEQVNETTVFDDVARVRQFFKHCYEQEWTLKNIALRLRCPKPSAGTRDTGHLVMKKTMKTLELSPVLDSMVRIMWHTGLRISEVYRIKKEDIHETFLHVRCDPLDRTKSARARTVPISASCHARLRMMTHQVLPGEHTVRRALKAESKRLDITPAITPHALRHTRASLWAAEHKTLVQIQRWLGHSDQRTTQGYIHPLPGQVEEHTG